MLGHNVFYHGTARKLVTAFGSLFTDIYITRTDPDEDVDVKYIKVPLTYGPKEKWLYRLTQNPTPGIDDQIEMILPRMAFEMTGFTSDPSRNLTATGRTVKAIVSDNTLLKAQYNPAPWDLGFQLSIMTKNVDDGLQIVEQILPFFRPEFSVTVNDIPELGLKKDIPIILTSVVCNDSNWDGQFTERRTIIWELSFTAKAYFYPPVAPTKVVLKATVNFEVDGETSNASNSLPTFTSIPDDGVTAETVTTPGILTTKLDSAVKILVLPSSATLGPSQSKTFTISILNTSNLGFSVTVPDTAVTVTDTYSSTVNSFIYTCGTGRTSQETLSIRITASADPTRFATVTVTLTP